MGHRLQTMAKLYSTGLYTAYYRMRREDGSGTWVKRHSPSFYSQHYGQYAIVLDEDAAVADALAANPNRLYEYVDKNSGETFIIKGTHFFEEYNPLTEYRLQTPGVVDIVEINGQAIIQIVAEAEGINAFQNVRFLLHGVEVYLGELRMEFELSEEDIKNANR